jgi:hypothetical protein
MVSIDLWLASMTRLRQSRNNFGDAGALLLGEGLKLNNSLVALDVVSSSFVLLAVLYSDICICSREMKWAKGAPPHWDKHFHQTAASRH